MRAEDSSRMMLPFTLKCWIIPSMGEIRTMLVSRAPTAYTKAGVLATTIPAYSQTVTAAVEGLEAHASQDDLRRYLGIISEESKTLYS